jgi:peptide/nickel transport system permease protein
MSTLLTTGGTATDTALPQIDGRPAARHGVRLARRIVVKTVGAIVVVIAAASVTFFAQLAVPGDRATVLLNTQTGQQKQYSAAELAPVRKQFGFDNPIVVQYLHYVGGLFRGDLGTSYTQHRPVTQIVGGQLLPSLILTVCALVVAWALAIAVTQLTVKRNRVLSAIGSGLETITACLPQYWIGIVLLVIFSVELRWFPVIGGSSATGTVLPIFTLAIPLAGFLGQVTRDELEKVLDQPFITSARARGQSDAGVRLRHALRHAVLPAVTLTGWAFGALLSGSVLAESIFGRPGIGQVLVNAVNTRDVPTVAGVVLAVAVAYVIANLAVDIAYAVIDPRLRSRG